MSQTLRSYFEEKSVKQKSEIQKVDLHGLTIEEAKNKLESALDKALLNDTWCLEVIHGRGTGALKNMTKNYFKSSKHITRFNEDPINPGVTKGYLF